MTPAPIVIAHRGASGYLPEHTLAAKALAHGLGADFLEQDVVATRDGTLVVLHDLYLDDVTDVAQRFPKRRREDGRHYVVDFDLDELKTLQVFERRLPGSAAAKYPERFPAEVGIPGIVSLADELRFIQGLNKSTGRTVGIYPEIKEPEWHRRAGIDLAARLLAELAAFGYKRAADPVFVQCFDAAELVRVKQELSSDLKLIQLVGAEAKYEELLTPVGLRRVAAYASGLGPHHAQLATGAAGRRPQLTPLTQFAQDCGLALHPYTFRRDDLPAYARSLEEWLEFFIVEARVEGLFCDHPDVAVRVRAARPKVQ
ncbi:MAG TPA: glycerophosphodiester phosphodiesterase [Gammaproteobacteria bacterium]|nr:glycerophosphodiester phosphodiesterase [Gammaproteobacteria bacterium]